jgi:TIR domain/HEAT repeats/NACHT domain
MPGNGLIFISYARADGRGYADRLYSELTARGLVAWRDTRTLNPGEDFTAVLEKAVEQARRVVVCVTPNIKRDDGFVRREIGYALSLNIPIIPLMFAEVLPPRSIVNVARVNFYRQTWGTAVGQLLDWLEQPAVTYGQSSQPGDQFRRYLQTLYSQIVGYLDSTVQSQLPPVHVQATPEAIKTTAPTRVVSFFGRELQMKAAPDLAAEEGSVRYDRFDVAFESYNGRVLLLGEPESGKTMTLMAYARDAVARRLEDPSEPLPLLGRISDWPADVARSLTDWLGHVAGPLQIDAIIRAVSDGKVLFLLDGLDELGSKRKAAHSGEVYDPRQRFFLTMPYNNRIVVTCRVSDYQDIGAKISLAGAVTLLPLDETQVVAALQNYPELLAAAQADDELFGLMRTPLFLSLFTREYQALGNQAHTLASAPGSVWHLCRKVLEAYFERRYQQERHKPNADLLPCDMIRRVLTRVAVRDALENMGNRISLEAIDEAFSYTVEQMYPKLLRRLLAIPIARQGFNRVRERLQLRKPDVTIFLAQVLRLHVLVPAEPGTFGFIHVLLRDCFAVDQVLAAFGHPEPGIRMAAAQVLGDIRDIRAVEPLLTGLRDADPGVRTMAAQALGDIGDTRAVEPLLKALYDADPGVRMMAAQALGEIGDTRRSPDE